MKNKALKIIAFIVVISTVCCFFASAVSGEGIIAALSGNVATPATPGEATPADPATPVDPATPEDPTIPEDPTEPATPVDPATPEDPTTPATPEDPTTPATPEDPTTPADDDESIFVKIVKFIINIIKWVIDFVVSIFC